MEHSKKRVFLITGTIMFVVIFMYIIISIVNEKTEILYTTSYSLSFGSRTIKIYKNGKVYEDTEIEEPNHKPDYKYLKTLSKDNLKELNSMLENNDNSETIKEYVTQLVYGVRNFNDLEN